MLASIRIAHWSPTPRATRIAAALLSVVLLTASVTDSVAAAGGSKPTRFSTGTVDCESSLILGEAWLIARKPHMWTEGTTFNGYVKAASRLQRWDGDSWRTVIGSKRSHGRTRIPGSGASAFRNATWTWTISASPHWRAYRVRTTFIWLNRSLEVVAHKVRTADYYTSTLSYLGVNGYPQRDQWVRTGWCDVYR
jgi:hypothetical protein